MQNGQNPVGASRPAAGRERRQIGSGGPKPDGSWLQLVAAFIIHHRAYVLIMALLLLLPALYGLARLKVEYDLIRYLPQDLESIRGLDVLNRRFGFESSATVVVKNRPEWEVDRLKKEIERIKGVSSVFWLSDVADFSIPRSFQQDLAEPFYRKDATLLVVQFREAGSADATRRALARIQRRLKDGMFLVGSMVATEELRDKSQREKPVILAVSLLSLLIVLTVTLPSFAAPLLFMITLGCSVVWNLGLTCFLKGQISYVTDSFGAALQLGVTMDYCVFLLHRFEEEQGKGLPAEEAMVAAVRRTLVAILASSATTIAGFMALGTMKVRIGADLGYTMARGVLIAVVAAVTVLPCLTLMTQPLIDRLRHRPLVPSFSGIGRVVTRFHIPLFIALLLLAIPAWHGRSRLQVSYDLEQTMSEVPSVKRLQQLRREYGVTDVANILTRDLPAWRNIALEQQLVEMPGVRRISSYNEIVGTGIPTSFVPPVISHRFLSGGFYNIEVTLAQRAGSPVGGHTLAEMSTQVPRVDGEAYLTGQCVVDYDLRRLSEQDMTRIDRLTPVLIAAIIAISFGSVSVPLLLVLVILVAIWANQSIVFFSGGSVFFFATVALSCIQLGATVDYAILITSRYREERERHSAAEAARRAVAGSAGAVLTSGLTLCAATIGIYLFSSLSLLADLALLLARGAIISMFAAIFLLPAALLVLDRIFPFTSLKWPSSAGKSRKHLAVPQ